MMTAEERSEWLEVRKTGIGGSEVGALLSHIIPEVKYGCRRNLWYEKTNFPQDFEQEETAPMRLGQLMEGPICDLYSEITGRRIEEVGRMIHPDHPELGVSLDRLVHAAEKPRPGIIEAKNLGSRNFFKVKREGALPVEYAFQANHGMMVAGAALGVDIDWAVMVIGKSDDPKLIARALDWHMKVALPTELNPSYLIYWEVEKDHNICNAILREGPAFWKTLGRPELMPDRLEEPDDPRCSRCQWRVTCRGTSLLPAADQNDIPVAPELTPLADEYLSRKKDLDQAEELVAETKELFMILLGERQAAQVPIGGKMRPVYWRTEDGSPLYADAVKNMGAQYTLMRQRLIDLKNPGAEEIPVPSSFIKRGKNKRPLRLQYLDPAPKKEKE